MNDTFLEAKFFLQLFLNIFIFFFNVTLLRSNIHLTIELNKLRKEFDKFNKLEDNIDDKIPYLKPIEFKYVSLEGNICSIKEYIHPYLQRHLYYYEDNKNNKANNISNGVNNEIINIKTNNTNNNIISNIIDENKNILDDNSNNIEIEMQKAYSDDTNN